MRTIEINWKGKIGYGDIISPLCYSHVLAVKNGIEVQLNMYWETSKGHLFKEKDSESLDYRQRFLFDLIEPVQPDRKSTRPNSSHTDISRMPSSA